MKVKCLTNLEVLTALKPGAEIEFAGGDLHLDSLTTLPEGVTLSAGGYLDLGSLTTLPEGVTLSAGGYQLKGMGALEAHLSDLKPWRQEMADCIAAFATANSQTGDWCQWLHHEIRFEKLTEPWRNRVNFIASTKAEAERAQRFRMMRPLPKDADIQKLVRDVVNPK